MPFSIQSHNGVICNWILATLTFGGEQFLEIWFAVDFAFLFEEWLGGHWFFAWAAACEVLIVPCFSQGLYNFLTVLTTIRPMKMKIEKREKNEL